MDVHLMDQETVFGSNFKVRCGVCMASSGWKTLREVNEWWSFHQHATHHNKMAKFIKKI